MVINYHSQSEPLTLYGRSTNMWKFTYVPKSYEYQLSRPFHITVRAKIYSWVTDIQSLLQSVIQVQCTAQLGVFSDVLNS